MPRPAEQQVVNPRALGDGDAFHAPEVSLSTRLVALLSVSNPILRFR